MKAAWIALGVLGGAYALYGAYQLVSTVMTVGATSTYGPTLYGSSVAVVCIGLIANMLGKTARRMWREFATAVSFFAERSL